MTIHKPVVFFVDSEDEHRDLLNALLTERGYQVRAFGDGSKLIKYLNGDGAKIRPSLILLDVSSQGLGGFEAARRLTQMNGKASIPLIMMAKHCSAEDKIEAQTAGALTCLQKPVDLAKIEAEIEDKKNRDAKNKSVIKQQFKINYE